MSAWASWRRDCSVYCAFWMSRSRWASACLPSDAVSAMTRILVGCGLRDGGFAQGDGAADGGVAFGFGGGDLGVALDAGDVGPAHVGDVLVLVADLADGEGDDFEAHLGHVVHAGGAHALGDHLGLFDDLLDGELADDAAEMAFHDEADEAFALVGCLERNCSAAVRMDSSSERTLICATASTVTATPCLV